MSRSVERLKLLVEHCADPHAVAELGWNALHAALDVNGAEANRPEVVHGILLYLHELGLDPGQRNARGMTPTRRADLLGTKTEKALMQSLRSGRGRKPTGPRKRN